MPRSQPSIPSYSEHFLQGWSSPSIRRGSKIGEKGVQLLASR